jgi:hypothetical protein
MNIVDINMDDFWECCHGLVGDEGYEEWDDDDDPYPWVHAKSETKTKLVEPPTTDRVSAGELPRRNFNGFVF